MDTMYTTVFIRASNGQYVCAEGGGGGELVANRTIPLSWETFGIVDPNGLPFNSGDNIAIQTFDGRFVCAEGGGGEK